MKKTVDLSYSNAISLLEKLDSEQIQIAVQGETRTGILKKASSIVETYTGSLRPASEVKDDEFPSTPQTTESAPEETTPQDEDVLVPAISKKRRKGTTPWKRTGRLEIPDTVKDWAKKNGYRFRWVNSGQAGRLQQKRSEGFEVFDLKMLPKSIREDFAPVNLIDGSTQLSGSVNVAELQLMMTTEENAQDREVFYREKSEKAMRNQESQIKDDVSKEGIKISGSIREEQK